MCWITHITLFSEGTELSPYRFVFIIAQVLHGVGKLAFPSNFFYEWKIVKEVRKRSVLEMQHNPQCQKLTLVGFLETFEHHLPEPTELYILLEVTHPYNSVSPSVGWLVRWSVCHNFLKGRKVSLPTLLLVH